MFLFQIISSEITVTRTGGAYLNFFCIGTIPFCQGMTDKNYRVLKITMIMSTKHILIIFTLYSLLYTEKYLMVPLLE